MSGGEHIVLVGMMGTGKTTVGRLLADARGWRLVDSDEQIERACGRTVKQIFETEGEATFRRLESEALAAALADPAPAVIAAAGGVVLDPANRELLRRAGTVVWLTADPDLLAGRVPSGDHRPLLADDPVGTLRRLSTERHQLYADVADHVVDIDELSPDDVAARITELLGVIVVEVPVGDRAYEVVIGPGLRHDVAAHLPLGARRAAIVTQPTVGVEIRVGVEHRTFTIPDGEAAKTLATIEVLCSQFAEWGLTRGDVVVAVGGGVVTDTAGFVAAVYHRGVAVVHVPTTLLAMVDAAVGGKTGVNLPEGKNLVGAFWQPTAVVCDTEVLSSLPPREQRSGTGEMAKYHFLTGEDLSSLPLEERIAACVRIKAAIVGADEREGPNGRRATLNYGHTLAHALETTGGYDLRHGEAVAIGLVYAAELARVLGRIEQGRVDEHRKVLAAYDLPTTLPARAEPAHLIAQFARDKKAVGGVTFVLDGPAGVEIVTGIDTVSLEAAFEAIR